MGHLSESGLRILAVLPWPDEPTTDGYAQRSHMIIDALAQMGELDVIVVSPNTPQIPDSIQQMSKRLTSVAHLPLSSGALSCKRSAAMTNSAEMLFGRLFRAEWYFGSIEDPQADFPFHAKQKKYDVVFYRSIQTYCYLSRYIKGSHSIIDFDDRPSDALKKNTETALTKLRSVFFSILERKIALKANGVCVVKPEDAQDLPPETHTFELNNMPYFRLEKGNTLPLPSEPTIAFIGSFRHAPNVDGAFRLAKKIMPMVLAQIPNAKLILAGVGMDEHRDKFGTMPSSIIWAGKVDDVADVYRQSCLVACPMTFGPGSNLKLPEAICYHRPVLASRHATRGQPQQLIDSGVIMVADNDEEFADHCIKLFQDDALLSQKHRDAEQMAETLYPKTYFEERLKKFFDQL